MGPPPRGGHRLEQLSTPAGGERSAAAPGPGLAAQRVSYEGLIPGRARDIASLGVISGAFSRYLRGASAETVIEANYQVMVTPGSRARRASST